MVVVVVVVVTSSVVVGTVVVPPVVVAKKFCQEHTIRIRIRRIRINIQQTREDINITNSILTRCSFAFLN